MAAVRSQIRESIPGWMAMAEDHWQEFRPTLYRELMDAGRLEQALRDAAEQTAREMEQLMEAGLLYHQAWEAVGQNYLILPEEEGLEEEAEPDPLFETFSEFLRESARIMRERDEELDNCIPAPGPRQLRLF